MPTVNISQADFEAAANGAWECFSRGKMQEAAALDKLARKINAALSASSIRGPAGLKRRERINWQDVPSVLAPLNTSSDSNGGAPR